MMKIDTNIQASELKEKLARFWEVSGQKIRAIESEYDADQGAPVFTVEGKYTTRGWTEWTQGFQYGAPILQFDATGDEAFLDIGRRNTVERMAPHVTHFGVHDHGFNNVSTYGNLLRLMNEGRLPFLVEAWRVNWLTTRISPPMSLTERFILSSESPKILIFAPLPGSHSTSLATSHSSTPSRITRPGPISETI